MQYSLCVYEHGLYVTQRLGVSDVTQQHTHARARAHTHTHTNHGRRRRPLASAADADAAASVTPVARFPSLIKTDHLDRAPTTVCNFVPPSAASLVDGAFVIRLSEVGRRRRRWPLITTQLQLGSVVGLIEFLRRFSPPLLAGRRLHRANRARPDSCYMSRKSIINHASRNWKYDRVMPRFLADEVRP